MLIGVKIDKFKILKEKEILVKLKSLGVKHIEIQIKDCDLDSIYFTKKFTSYINEMILKYNFSISFHCTLGVNYIEKINRLRKTAFVILNDMLELCKKTNARWLTLHIGECGSGREVLKGRLDKFVEELDMLIKQNNINCIIALENMPVSKTKIQAGDDIDDLVKIMERSNSNNLRILFDIGHYELSNKSNIEDFLKYVVGVHIHDNNGLDDTHSLLGTGKINLNNIVKTILNYNKDIPIIIEYRNFDIKQIEYSIKYLNDIYAEWKLLIYEDIENG